MLYAGCSFACQCLHVNFCMSNFTCQFLHVNVCVSVHFVEEFDGFLSVVAAFYVVCLFVYTVVPKQLSVRD